MQLGELLNEVSFINSKKAGTPIELSYYKGYSWQHSEPYESRFFASLDFSFAGGPDFVDGEVVGIEATDLGIKLNVVTG